MSFQRSVVSWWVRSTVNGAKTCTRHESQPKDHDCPPHQYMLYCPIKFNRNGMRPPGVGRHANMWRWRLGINSETINDRSKSAQALCSTSLLLSDMTFDVRSL